MPWSGHIRATSTDDLPFIGAMLFEAFFWRPEDERPPLEAFLDDPEFHLLLKDWGRAGDTGVIAEDGAGAPIGAAWYRFFTEEEHFHGFVDAETPEIGIGVVRHARGRGIGAALMCALIAAAREAGLRKLSLSVIPENFARGLYERLGFRKVGVSGTAWTMVLDLEDDA